MSNVVNASDEKQFYVASRDWEADTLEMRSRSERRAWFVAATASLIAIIAVAGIAMLAPFKQTVPYVLSVDKSTGNIDVVNTLSERSISNQELQEKFWSKRYVTARESYLWTLLQYDYDTVLRLSDQNVARDFAALYEGEDARDKKYGSGVEMTVKILSITLPPDETGKAVIRFEKTTKRLEANAIEPPQTFVATLAFKFEPNLFAKEKDLIENPLGFKVTSYRIDSEISTATQPKVSEVERIPPPQMLSNRVVPPIAEMKK
jgi:type IV secretion system protein VirB8